MMGKEESEFKIGVFGSAVNESTDAQDKALVLGRELGRSGVTVITGACSGMPYMVAREARAGGARVVGYSPESNFEAQGRSTPNDDLSIYDEILYVDGDFPYPEGDMARKKLRNVMSTRACAAGIIVSGRWGTLNEFTNLFDMGKVIGVLTGTGGVADELNGLMEVIKKPSKAEVLFSDDPSELVEQIMRQLDSKRGKKGQ